MSTSISEFIKSNETAYYPASINPDMSGIMSYDADGAVATVHGNSIPIIDTAFDLALVQPGSVQSNKELAPKVGKLWMKLSAEDSEFYDELYLIPICIVGYRRSKFAKFDNSTKASAPLCYSSNGLLPSNSMSVAPDCNECATLEKVNGSYVMNAVCPSAMWKDGDKPACQLSMSVAFMTIGDCIPVIMNLHGVGMSAFNKLKRESKKAKNIARIRHKSLENYVIRLTTDNAGTYVSPVFSFVEAPAEFGDIAPYRDIAVHFRNTLFTRATEEEKPADNTETDSEIKPIATTGESFDI